MINSLMPYNGEEVTVRVTNGNPLTGVLHIQSPEVVFIGPWRVGVDKIVAWKLAGV